MIAWCVWVLWSDAKSTLSKGIICCPWPGEKTFFTWARIFTQTNWSSTWPRRSFPVTTAILHFHISVFVLVVQLWNNWLCSFTSAYGRTELSWGGSWIRNSTPGIPELPLFQVSLALEKAQRAALWCKCCVPDCCCSLVLLHIFMGKNLPKISSECAFYHL